MDKYSRSVGWSKKLEVQQEPQIVKNKRSYKDWSVEEKEKRNKRRRELYAIKKGNMAEKRDGNKTNTCDNYVRNHGIVIRETTDSACQAQGTPDYGIFNSRIGKSQLSKFSTFEIGSTSMLSCLPNYTGEDTVTSVCNNNSNTSLASIIRNSNIRKKINLHDLPMETHLLTLSTLCKYCGAKKFQYESKGFCCSDGEIVLKINGTPNNLYELFTSNSDESQNFRTYVRTYNSNFAFTSFGVKYDKDLCRSNKGIYTFRVQGQIYHYINQLVPPDNHPKYLQLYFYDTEHELENRFNFSDKLSLSTLSKIIDILNINPYSQFFRNLRYVSKLENHQIKIRSDPGLDQRVYNTPSASQVAAVWVDDDPSAECITRDINVFCHNGQIHKINYYFACYDPLQYPLLFPYGDSGWHKGIQKIAKRNQACCSNEKLIDFSQIHSPSELLICEERGNYISNYYFFFPFILIFSYGF
ncbi:uncharacterized protein LOC133035082 isoform X2 [Cannabis sativa]|uniref:uncharacterized protein LOC133035082 isoform X2 n=1 Tax=Cannabis sativa TaxID=3483 RepID=UPI0029C9CF87|nr:uncharacterized protein LOC133035082 isoform X2 [Cannabis sativa]